MTVSRLPDGTHVIRHSWIISLHVEYDLHFMYVYCVLL